jgi:hypothetical protein
VAIGVGPEEGEQVVAGDGCRVGGQIIEQGPTFAPGNGYGLVSVKDLGRAQQANR